MPQYEYKCPVGHRMTILRKIEDRAKPMGCECGMLATLAVSQPAHGIVTGSANPVKGGARSHEGFRVVEETGSFVVRQKGDADVVVDWACDPCGTADLTFVADASLAVPTMCIKCGEPMTRKVGVPTVDWFTANGFHASGGYYSDSLGQWIKSPEHRKQVMDELGVREAVEDRTAELKAAERQMEIEAQDREVYNMLNIKMPDTPDVRKARAEGLIPDETWARDDLKAKYGWT